MIVSDSHRFIFWHIPRTGGSSISEALSPITNKGHGSVSVGPSLHYGPMHVGIGSWVEPKEWLDYFWFAFVRNPFSRALSAYHARKGYYSQSKLSRLQKGQFKNAGIEVPIEELSFEQFLENEVGNPCFIMLRQTQSDFLYKGECRDPDFVGRFENLTEDWETICKTITWGGKRLGHLNNTNLETKDYRKHYNQRSRQIVQDFFVEDMERWNYEF